MRLKAELRDGDNPRFVDSFATVPHNGLELVLPSYIIRYGNAERASLAGLILCDEATFVMPHPMTGAFGRPVGEAIRHQINSHDGECGYLNPDLFGFNGHLLTVWCHAASGHPITEHRLPK